ncbi:hypothetical protein C8J57DRAFT_1478653 [Mycena rebaudengoi]|nr:hypothetical protein C8J57DRAFT_1478653 [Mycena rebaudengoi]
MPLHSPSLAMATPAATTLALANPNPKSPDAKPRKGTIQPCAPHIVKPALAIDSECPQTPHACAINLSYDFDFAADRGSAARRDLEYILHTPLQHARPSRPAAARLRNAPGVPPPHARAPCARPARRTDARREARARRVPHARERRAPRSASYEQPGAVDLARGSATRVGARKADTDAEYNAWAEVLLDTVAADVKAGGAPRLGVLFGTHSWASCEKIFVGVVHPDQPLADLGRGSLCAS